MHGDRHDPRGAAAPNTTDSRWATVDQVAFAAKLTEVCPAVSPEPRTPTATLPRRRSRRKRPHGGSQGPRARPGRWRHRRGHRGQCPRRGRESHQLRHAGERRGSRLSHRLRPGRRGHDRRRGLLTSDRRRRAAESPAPSIRSGGVRVVLINGPAWTRLPRHGRPRSRTPSPTRPRWCRRTPSRLPAPRRARAHRG